MCSALLEPAEWRRRNQSTAGCKLAIAGKERNSLRRERTDEKATAPLLVIEVGTGWTTTLGCGAGLRFGLLSQCQGLLAGPISGQCWPLGCLTEHF